MFDSIYSAAFCIILLFEMIKERVSVSEPRQWIRGRGWDEALFDEQRYIDKNDLDPVAPVALFYSWISIEKCDWTMIIMLQDFPCDLLKY